MEKKMCCPYCGVTWFAQKFITNHKCNFCNFEFNDDWEGLSEQKQKEKLYRHECKEELNIVSNKNLYLCHYIDLKSKLIVAKDYEEAYQKFKNYIKDITVFDMDKIDVDTVNYEIEIEGYKVLLQEE